MNYADFLECIAPNVKHFDRWLVVTHESDTRTQEVCRRFGMEVLLSQRLYENGAVFHKAAALNEGLEALDQDGWVAVMDSDILLPHDFRERLEFQALDKECLYGLGGRRICNTLHEFTTLAASEPWADNLIHTTFVIGFFNLFHLSQERNRYPDDVSTDASTYDVVFSDRFPAPLRRYLPFVCLHAGAASRNWWGRVTDPFFDEGTLDEAARVPDQTAAVAAVLGGPGKKVAQIGCYRGQLTNTLADQFGLVHVIDYWGLLTKSPSTAMAADLAFLAERYAAETAGTTGISALLTNSDATLAGIPDGSLDVLWLSAEPDYDFLLNFLPLWLPKLKAGGTVAGRFYDPRLLPGPSQVVHLLLGVPEQTFPDFHWIKRIANPAALAARLVPQPPPAATKRGVVYVCMKESDVEGILVSWQTLRQYWHGPVTILSAGEESPSLRLACIRLGLDFRHVPAASDRYPELLNLLHAVQWSPYDETVYLGAATLLRGSPEFLFEAAAAAPEGAAFCRSQGRNRLQVETAAFAFTRYSPVIDLICGLSAAFIELGPQLCALRAIAAMVESGELPVIPAGPVWSGPVKRMPEETRILAMPRLARAGALHLIPAWQEAEAAVIALMQRPPEERQGAVT